jgi:hypothetical protein
MYQLNKRTRDAAAPVIADLLSHVLAGIRAPSYECQATKGGHRPTEIHRIQRQNYDDGFVCRCLTFLPRLVAR